MAVVGAGASGRDIALQLSKVAKSVYLLHCQASPSNDSFGPPFSPNCFERAKVVRATADSLLLEDGSSLDGVDWVIYCTGYKYIMLSVNLFGDREYAMF